MPDAPYDVAVVGAGPAGSVLSISLRAGGVGRVALIDRASFPRDKACGDGIGPGAVKVAGELGFAGLFDGREPVRRLALSSPGGIAFEGDLPEVGGARPIGYVIPRLEFDDALVRAAFAAGAADLTGHELAAAAFDQSDGLWHLTLRQDGRTTSLAARILVGADGARSRVRRLLGIPANGDRHTGIAVRVYAQTAMPTPTRALRLDFRRHLLPGYGWVFPIGASRANVGIGIDLESYKRGSRHLRELLAAYLPEAEARHGHAADPATEAAAILPYGSRLPPLADPDRNAALIGDAASMINPFTGEGIFYAMAAARMLGERLAAARRDLPGAALADFERSFRHRFAAHFRLNALIRWAMRSPRWCDMVMRACATDRRIEGELIEMMLGDRRRLRVGALAGIVRRNLMPRRAAAV